MLKVACVVGATAPPPDVRHASCSENLLQDETMDVVGLNRVRGRGGGGRLYISRKATIIAKTAATARERRMPGFEGRTEGVRVGFTGDLARVTEGGRDALQKPLARRTHPHRHRVMAFRRRSFPLLFAFLRLEPNRCRHGSARLLAPGSERGVGAEAGRCTSQLSRLCS